MIPNIDRDPEAKDTPEETEFVEFGEEAFAEFMDQIRAKVMIRSHEPEESGAKIMFNGRLVTIFSNGGNKSKLGHYKYKNRIATSKIAIVNLEEDKERWEKDDFEEIKYIDPNL